MPIEIPDIDDRDYKEILNESLARIRVHNPEWNNYNDSDPGVTLLQLFSFMGESLLYRANRIPERNRLKFLTLLGVPLQAAEAATGLVSISNNKALQEVLTLPADQELKAGKLPFRTLDAIDVLPVEAAVYYKREVTEQTEELEQYWEALYAGHEDKGALHFYETLPLETPKDPANLPVVDMGASDSMDRTVWVALLARDAASVGDVRAELGNKILNLGMYPAQACDARCELSAGDTKTGLEDLPLVFELATGEMTASGSPRYKPLAASIDTDVLARPGIVRLTMPDASEFGSWSFSDPLVAGTGQYPPILDNPKDQTRLVTWLRVRMARQTEGAGMTARFHWLGINATRVSQRARAVVENPGAGNGEADQNFRLINTPVLADSVRITVNGESWSRIDDLLAAGPEIRVNDPRRPPGSKTDSNNLSTVFVVDRESGEIRFGDGIHGTRPPQGAVIRVVYDYGGGADGNVNIGAISKGASLPAGFNVTNPLPCWGGAEAESVEAAERNIPRYLQHHDRMVTADDFTDIVARTPGVDIGRVELLPLFDPRLKQDGVPGMATLLVVPKTDILNPSFPEPDARMLEQVCAHVAPRRLVTTEIHIRGPEYQGVVLSVGIEVVPGQDVPPVREAVNQALREFLTPLMGGRETVGWPLDKSVVARELWAEATRVEGVAYVNQLLLGNEQGTELEEITLSGLQMPKLLMVETRQGEATSLAEVLGNGDDDSGGTSGVGGGSADGTGTGTGNGTGTGSNSGDGSGAAGEGGNAGSDDVSGGGSGDGGSSIIPVPVIPAEC